MFAWQFASSFLREMTKIVPELCTCPYLHIYITICDWIPKRVHCLLSAERAMTSLHYTLFVCMTYHICMLDCFYTLAYGICNKKQGAVSGINLYLLVFTKKISNLLFASFNKITSTTCFPINDSGVSYKL